MSLSLLLPSTTYLALRHRPSLELIILWLSVYVIVVPGLTVMAVVLVHLTDQIILAVLVGPASLYLYLWLAVYSYYSQAASADQKGWLVSQIFSRNSQRLFN